MSKRGAHGDHQHFYQLARLFYSSNRTHDSYFWEARRLVGDSQFSPRDAFVRAVAGQPPMGYERVVLDHGDLPPEFAASVGAVVQGQLERQDRLRSMGQRLMHQAPTAAPGLEVTDRPLLDAGRFVPARTLVSKLRPEGVPCSALVEAVVARCDGTTTVSDMPPLSGGPPQPMRTP